MTKFGLIGATALTLALAAPAMARDIHRVKGPVRGPAAYPHVYAYEPRLPVQDATRWGYSQGYSTYPRASVVSTETVATLAIPSPTTAPNLGCLAAVSHSLVLLLAQEPRPDQTLRSAHELLGCRSVRRSLISPSES